MVTIPTRSSASAAALFAACALLVSGCGPILSTQALSDAERALADAEAADAEALAVYEFTSATEYVDKAREEWGYSDFRAALTYARRARDFARDAQARALANPMRGAPRFDEVIDVP